jgi:MFS family permease
MNKTTGTASRMNLWKSLRGLPRDLWLLAVATLMNRLGMMALPFLILYLTRELHFTPAGAGLVFGLYGVGAIVAAPVSGWLCDRIGGLPIIQASLIGSGIALLLFPFVGDHTMVVLLTILWALINEAGRPAVLTLISDLVPAEQRKPAFAVQRLAINLGMSVGPAAGGFIATHSFRSIFVVNAASSLAAAAFLFIVPMSSAARRHARQSDELARVKQWRLPAALDDRRLFIFLVGVFLVAAVFFQHEGVLPLFLVQDLSLSMAFYGMLFTINTLMIVFLEVPLNAATAHWPHRRGLGLGAVLFALGSGMFGLARGPVMIIAGIVVWTFGEMMLFPQASAYVADIAPDARRGEYMGAYSMAFSTAFAVAPGVGAWLFQRFGGPVVWGIVFGVGLIAAATMSLVSSAEPTPEPAPA